MEKVEKIGSFEAVAFIVIVMINQISLNIPNSILQLVGSSAWINVIFITFLACIFCIFIYKFYKPFPNEDIIDISEYLGGSILKSVVGIMYIFLFFEISALLLKYLSECLRLIYFPTTPILYILGFFVVATLIATQRGISGIIRNNLILLPFMLVSIVSIFFSVAKFFVWQRGFPILGHGFNETFLSGISNIFAFGGFANIYFLMPMLKEKKNFKKLSIIGIVVSGLYLLISVVSLLLVFSYSTSSRQMLAIYPLTRLIEYGRFFQRIDAFYILFWIMAAFSYISTNVILSLEIFKKITLVQSTKTMAPAFTLIILGIALSFGSVANFKFFADTFHKYYYLFLAFIFTPLVLVLAYIKWVKKDKSKHINNGNTTHT